MSRAYVVTGAVIISDDGTTVKYHPQCPNCGRVETGTTCSGHVARMSNLGYCNCFKCGKSFPVQINRGC